VDELADPTPRRPLSPARTAAVGVAVLALLAAVSAATGARGRAQVPGGGLAAGAGRHAVVWGVLVLVPLGVAVGAALFVYGQVLRRRRTAETAAARRRARRRAVALGALAIALLVYWLRTGRDPLGFIHVHNPLHLGTGGSAAATPGAGHHGGVSSVDAGLAAVTWAALVVVALIAVRRIRRRRAAADDPALVHRPAVAAEEVDVDALRREPDPRRAVIAAYAAMERVMAARAFGRRRAEAPLEYAGRLAAAGAAGADHARRLTGLYVVARFGTRPVVAAERTAAADAVAALVAAGASG
jgi:hypothetical protein